MKVLFLTSYFYPEQAASSYLGDNIRSAICDARIEIELYTPVPSRGISSELRNKYIKKKYECLLDNRMYVHRFSLMKEGKSPLQRAFRYFLCCLKQFYFGVFSKEAKQCDVLFATSTPPIQGAMAAFVKRFRKIPFVYNLQDIFPDSLTGTGLTKKGSLMWKIGCMIENYTYRHADKIIVISEDFKKNIMAKGVPEDKIVVVYNWVDQNAVRPIEKSDNPFYSEFGLDSEKFRVVYAGNLGNAQNIDVILNAARRLKENEQIEFVIFGSGGQEFDIKKSIVVEKLQNVKFFPLQPLDKVSYVYSLGDLCIVSCKAGLGGSAMPSKTWNILSTARPVLANFDEGELKNLLESNDCGIFTKAGDVDALVDAITKVSKEPNRCDKMGRNGRLFVMDNLTREVGTQKYVEVIKSVVN